MKTDVHADPLSFAGPQMLRALLQVPEHLLRVTHVAIRHEQARKRMLVEQMAAERRYFRACERLLRSSGSSTPGYSRGCGRDDDNYRAEIEAYIAQAA